MRYLHKVEIPDTGFWHKLFRDPYQTHRTLYRWAGQCVWHTTETKTGLRIFLISDREDLTMESTECDQLDKIPGSRSLEGIHFTEGQDLRIQIRINAVKSDDRPVWTTAKMQGVDPRTALKEWVQGRLQQAGFESFVGAIEGLPFETFTKGSHNIKTAPVLVSGTVKVANPEKALTSLVQGIGQGKAFGLGMLMLR
jgi:CRISPR-associated protein Cas6/Cse3/CasE subtype I-E